MSGWFPNRLSWGEDGFLQGKFEFVKNTVAFFCFCQTEASEVCCLQNVYYCFAKAQTGFLTILMLPVYPDLPYMQRECLKAGV